MSLKWVQSVLIPSSNRRQYANLFDFYLKIDNYLDTKQWRAYGSRHRMWEIHLSTIRSYKPLFNVNYWKWKLTALCIEINAIKESLCLSLIAGASNQQQQQQPQPSTTDVDSIIRYNS